MTDPITRERFNPLAYVPALALALALAAGWADLKSDMRTTELRAEATTGRVASLETGATAQEARTRVLEMQQSRTDEKFNAIMSALSRLETRLEDETARP